MRRAEWSCSWVRWTSYDCTGCVCWCIWTPGSGSMERAGTASRNRRCSRTAPAEPEWSHSKRSAWRCRFCTFRRTAECDDTGRLCGGRDWLAFKSLGNAVWKVDSLNFSVNSICSNWYYLSRTKWNLSDKTLNRLRTNSNYLGGRSRLAPSARSSAGAAARTRRSAAAPWWSVGWRWTESSRKDNGRYPPGTAC